MERCTLAALAEDLGPVSSTHKVVYLQAQGIQSPLLASTSNRYAQSALLYRQAKHIKER